MKDLGEDPYAGADVTLTLTAKDEAGNEARSEPFGMRLPERLFTNSLARALIEQRRILALDANRNSEVYTALDALMIAPRIVHAGCGLLSRPPQPRVPARGGPHGRRAARGGGEHAGIRGHHRRRRRRRQR